MANTKRYKVFHAFREDINAGWLWISLDKDSERRQRGVVKVINPSKLNGKRRIYCEALVIDENFRSAYNNEDCSAKKGRHEIKPDQAVIVLNEWYRDKLGVKPGEEVDLGITYPCKLNFWANFWACAYHPQVVVRIAAWLALISIVLGILSLCGCTIPLPSVLKSILKCH